MTDRVRPVPDEASAPYWEACARHVLTLPRCARCGEFSFPADITCPNCLSLEPAFAYEPVSGRGRVRTWTVVRHSFLGGFDLPFTLVDVELDDHPKIRLIGQLIDGSDAPLKLGDAVDVAFQDLAPGVAIPAFRRVRP